MSDRNVAFLGGGQMGEALISGLIRSGGRAVEEIMVTCRRLERAHELAGKYGVTATLDNVEAVKWADVVVLMAKPQDIETLLDQIRGAVEPRHLIVSFAAGIRTSFVAVKNAGSSEPASNTLPGVQSRNRVRRIP